MVTSSTAQYVQVQVRVQVLEYNSSTSTSTKYYNKCNFRRSRPRLTPWLTIGVS